MALGAGLGIAGGLAGLFGAGEAAKAQAKYQKAAADALKVQTQAKQKALGIAENYDPSAETQKAVDYATATAGDQLGKSLSDLNQRFRNAGGSPGGDTLFRVQAQGATNRIVDPLKEWAANQASQATSLKLNALQTAMGMGGDLASNYLQLAQQNQPNYTGSIQSFAAGLNNPGLKFKTNTGNPSLNPGGKQS